MRAALVAGALTLTVACSRGDLGEDPADPPPPEVTAVSTAVASRDGLTVRVLEAPDELQEAALDPLRLESLPEGGTVEFDPTGQHLFVDLPSGEAAVADGEPILVAFRLQNTELSPTGNKVRMTIGGFDFLLDRSALYVIEGLEPGEVEIRFELVDARGGLIPGPLNDVTRTVTVG